MPQHRTWFAQVSPVSGLALRSVVVLAIGLAMVCLPDGPAVAQVGELPTMPTMPSVSAAAATAPVTVESVESLLKSVEAATDLDKDAKAKAVERLNAALVELRRVDGIKETAAKLQTEAKTAPERAAEKRSELATLLKTPVVAVTGDRALPELESDLASRQANLSTLKAGQKDREAERKRRPERQAALRKDQAQADLKRSEFKQQTDLPTPEGEHPAVTQARRVELEARRLTFESTLPALDYELAKYTAEEAVGMATAGDDLLKAKIEREEAAVRQLTEEVNRRRRTEADLQIEAASRQVLLAHPLLKPLAESNRLDAEANRSLNTRTEGVEREARQAKQTLEAQRQKFIQTKEKVEKIGLTRPIGMMLRRQRSEFPDLRELERHQNARLEVLNQAQLLSYEYAEQLKALPTAAEYVDEAAQESPLPVEERADVEQRAADLLAIRRNTLLDLVSLSNRYYEQLLSLSNDEELFVKEAHEYLQFINERILWTRSAETLTPAAVRDDAPTRNWLTSPARWLAVLQTLKDDPLQNPFAFWPTLVTVLALFYVRLRIRPRIRHFGEAACKRGFLRYTPTAQAAILTVMAAATVPFAVMFLSWRLAEGAEPTGFVRSVAVTLQWCAAFLFPVELFRESCRHLGLAEAHFAWPPRMIRELRRLMAWLKVAGMPLLFAAVLAHQHAPLAGGTPTERVLFAVGMMGAAALVHRALGRNSDLVRALVAERPDGPFARFRPLWYWLALAVPTGLCALSLLGYHYSAMKLADRLLLTLWLAPAVAIVRAMATRWVILSRRRLLLDQAYQRRAAAGEANDAGTPKPPIVEETDVARTTAQTRSLINAALLGLTACGLWMVWVDVLPAFNLLDRPVWYVSAETAPAGGDAATAVPGLPATDSGTGGGTPFDGGQIPVTTLDLALAILTAIFTAGAFRNLPGLMEMSVLTRLPLDNATRYAATRLASYAIIIVGVLLASNLLGLRWQNVQWLAAALTVGLGFGLQEVFANFVSGLIILFERPIRVGDIVTIDDVTGAVTKIRMRATTITNWDRKEFIVPNKEFITGRLMNWTLSDAVNRITIAVGVAYGSDTDAARAILLDIAAKHPMVLADPPPLATFEGFGDSTLDMKLRCFLPNIEQRLHIISDLHTSIDHRFKAAKIEIAFPQRDLHIRSVAAAALPFPHAAIARDTGELPDHRAAG